MAAQNPIDVATRETVNFLITHLPAGASLLEVGSGDGEVAAELSHQGFDVTALDAEPERVAKAQKLGVRASVASWPEYDSGPFDAITFTRSLHHIDPLNGAVEKAKALLDPPGKLLIEDFAFGETDSATVHWFVEFIRNQARPFVLPVKDQLVTNLLSSADPMQVWQNSHDHNLHSFTAISDAVAKHFIINETNVLPYLYRYLIPVLPETTVAAELVQRVFHEEERFGKEKRSKLMGRRIVASLK